MLNKTGRLGLGNLNNITNQTRYSNVKHMSTTPTDAKNFNIDLSVRQEPKYDIWQSELAIRIYKFLRGTGPKLDLLINVSPAGGKSSPISKAWQTVVEEAVGLYNVPKIVWVCANKTLTFEKYNDFRKDVIDMLIKHINIRSGHTPFVDLNRPLKTEIKMGDNPTIQHNLANIIMPLNTYTDEEIVHSIAPHLANEIRMGVKQLVGYEMMGSNVIDITDKTIAYSCTYSYAPKIIEKLKPRLIIIDELQERFPIESDSSKLDDKITSLLRTIENAPDNSSIIMLTGSMNISTCNSLVQILNIKTNRDFKTESAPALNRAALTVIPLIIHKPEDISKLAIDQIRSGMNNNLIAIFSTGKIISIANIIISKTPEFPPDIITGFKSHSNFNQQRYAGANKYNTTTIQNIAANIKNEFISPEWMHNHLESMITGTDENSKFLGRCIQHKFGFIFAPKNPDGTKAEFDVNDVILVQELFKLGKIHTVFATTMVGVGVNLSVNNLYIPTIQIYKGKNISQSDITQLVNRAGRKTDSFANIFCNPNDMEFIRHALDELPGNHIAIISFDEMKERLDYTTMIDGTVIKLNHESLKNIIKKHSITFLKSILKRN